MRKMVLWLLLLSLVFTCAAAVAEENRKMETKIFSLEMPEGWQIDGVEDYSEMKAILGNLATNPRIFRVDLSKDVYSSTLYVYEFPARDKAYIDQFSDRVKSSFEAMSIYGGMLDDVNDPQRVQYETDIRTFMMDEATDSRQTYLTATYYNQDAGIGYYFYLCEADSRNKEYESETAKTLMKECLLALKEPGVNTTIDPNAARVVVTGDSAKIRAEANIGGRLVKTAYKGESFTYVGTSGDFYTIVVDGQTAYIHKGVSVIQ